METLNKKRSRLRNELQVAYDAWMDTSEQKSGRPDTAEPMDMSGAPDMAKAQWFEYLLAKRRLVLAYAELPLAA